MIVLDNLPLPPSSNNMYAGVRHRHASEGLIQFKKDVEAYYWENQNIFKIGKTLISMWLKSPGIFVKMDIYLCFRRQRVLTKTEESQRNDRSNRIKALEDSIMNLFMIDDKVVWSGNTEKVIADDKDHDYALMIIQPSSARTVHQIRQTLPCEMEEGTEKEPDDMH